VVVVNVRVVVAVGVVVDSLRCERRRRVLVCWIRRVCYTCCCR
jgi:hypothetical protein